jgi:hypothetical protein
MEASAIGEVHDKVEDIVPLIQDWLQLCNQRHDCFSSQSEEAPLARLIEIADADRGILRLTEKMNSRCEYLTLSYRWGAPENNDYVTTSKNFESRRECFLLSSLPATLRGAIILTNWLNIKYIWIDAL